MKREVISTETAPGAIGPYSQAIGIEGMVFCSGQIPLDPATGSIVQGGIEEQTHQVMQNIKAVLTAAGSSFERIVKTTIFLYDMDDFAKVNRVYGEYFPADPPARSTVEVARLPRDVRVEIEVIALR